MHKIIYICLQGQPMGNGIEIDRLFLKNFNWSEACLRKFYKNDLISLEKYRPQSQDQFSKLKDIDKKLKLHTLEKFFSRGGWVGGNL